MTLKFSQLPKIQAKGVLVEVYPQVCCAFDNCRNYLISTSNTGSVDCREVVMQILAHFLYHASERALGFCDVQHRSRAGKIVSRMRYICFESFISLN